MSINVRIPPALNTKLGLIENREQVIRNYAGWLSPAEASNLRRAVEVFEEMPDDTPAPYPPI